MAKVSIDGTIEELNEKFAYERGTSYTTVIRLDNEVRLELSGGKPLPGNFFRWEKVNVEIEGKDGEGW